MEWRTSKADSSVFVDGRFLCAASCKTLVIGKLFDHFESLTKKQFRNKGIYYSTLAAEFCYRQKTCYRRLFVERENPLNMAEGLTQSNC